MAAPRVVALDRLMDAVDSPLWHRVAPLQPRLRAHVRVQRREARGEVWYLLIDPNSGRFHRVDRAAWEFVGRLDGRECVEALWSYVHERQGEEAPTQGDVVQMLAQLSDAELVSIDALPEFDALIKNKRRRERQRTVAAANPLAFKVPLFDPSTALNALLPLARWLFTPWGLLAWLALITAASAFAVGHFDPLKHAFRADANSAAFLLMMWGAYPVVKLAHEFGHGLAVRVWGGDVREIGINVMMLTPVPYIDASAATQFPQRHRRMLVGALGIMVELAIAALAVFTWFATSAPWLQQLALSVMVLCAASTLLFNGNPLARFDGYYILSDALEVPNLAAHANEVIARWARLALGIREAVRSPFSARAQIFLALYSVLALAYRWFVSLAIVHWLHEDFPALAAVVALLVAYTLVVRPFARGLHFVLFDARLNARRARALSIAAACAATVVGGVAIVPAPSVTVQEGVVWLPEQAVVRAETDGTLLALHAQRGQQVAAGQLIATLENLDLVGERETAAARHTQLDVEYFQALLTDPLRAQRVAAERDGVAARLARLDERLATLEVRAQVGGRLVLPREGESEGAFFAQGSEIGYVLTGDPMMVKVALTEPQAALVRERRVATRDTPAASIVSVRLAHAPDEELEGRIERETPGVTRELPSAVLGSAAGGPIATDPADPKGRQALQPVTVVDVRIDKRAAEHMGMRAWVRFEHSNETLAVQAVRWLRQLFLRSLGARQ